MTPCVPPDRLIPSEMSRIALNRFPALPASVTELIRLVPEDPNYYEHVLDACRADPGLASEVIRLAQSVGMGTRERVDSVHQALLLVGPRPAVSHLIGGALVKVFVPQATVVKRMWERNVWVASAASHLASDIVTGSLDPQVAHASAILHDLGQLAMACVDQDAMAAILADSRGDPERRLALETARFGEDHTQLGSRLASAWAFPLVFRFVIRRHHDSEIVGPEEAAPYARLVALADALADHDEDDPATGDAVTRRANDAGLPVQRNDIELLKARVERSAVEDVYRLGLRPVEPARVD